MTMSQPVRQVISVTVASTERFNRDRFSAYDIEQLNTLAAHLQLIDMAPSGMAKTFARAVRTAISDMESHNQRQADAEALEVARVADATAQRLDEADSTF